jgi:hypothetical protein
VQRKARRLTQILLPRGLSILTKRLQSPVGYPDPRRQYGRWCAPARLPYQVYSRSLAPEDRTRTTWATRSVRGPCEATAFLNLISIKDLLYSAKRIQQIDYTGLETISLTCNISMKGFLESSVTCNFVHTIQAANTVLTLCLHQPV